MTQKALLLNTATNAAGVESGEEEEEKDVRRCFSCMRP
jgi:hypothetical protein